MSFNKMKLGAAILMILLWCGYTLLPTTPITECEPATLNRGDAVQHKLTGSVAIIGTTFCSSGWAVSKRMYVLSSGEGDPIYWGQFEIELLR